MPPGRLNGGHVKCRKGRVKVSEGQRVCVSAVSQEVGCTDCTAYCTLAVNILFNCKKRELLFCIRYLLHIWQYLLQL